MIISRTPSNPNETANYSISLEDLAGLLSGTGTVTSFSATSTIPGITTTVSTATTTPSLTIGITGAPAAGTYLDNTGNFTTPAGGGGGIGTLQQVLQAGNVTGNNKIFAQGGASGGINIAENTDLTFGPSNQLTMRYNSNITESEIVETGTGGLTIAGSTTITLKAGLNGETYAIFNDNGAVSLRYDDVVKFETTTNGIKVTDRIEASTTNANLQVQGNGTGKLEVRSADSTTPGTIQLNCEQNSHGVSLQSPAHSAGATYTLKLPINVGNPSDVLQTDGNDPAQLSWVANAGGGSGITGSGVAGRVTFWTGTSTVSSDDTFLWDSTNNRLGVGGTTAPSYAIDVTGTNYYASNGTAFAYKAIGAGEAIRIGDVDGQDVQLALYDNTSTEIVRVVNGSVGIGTTTPGAYKLMVNGNVRITGAIADSSNSTGTAGQVLSSTVTGTDWIPNLTLTTNGTPGTAATLNTTTRILNIPTPSGGGGSGMTSFNLAGNTGTQQTISDSDTLSVLGGTYLATVASNTDTLTINHDATTRTNTTSSASPAAGGTFTAIDTLTTNATGHVTAVNTKTVTLPASSGGATDLNNTPSATDVLITSSTGTNTTIAEASAGGGKAGVISATSKAKLDIAIVGNTTSQTAPTIIKTLNQTAYNNEVAAGTIVASTIYVIV
jgi:hypothetical protein